MSSKAKKAAGPAAKKPPPTWKLFFLVDQGEFEADFVIGQTFSVAQFEVGGHHTAPAVWQNEDVQAQEHGLVDLARIPGLNEIRVDERGASLLLGQGMEYDVSNVVDPEFTIVAKMRKRYLGPPK